LGWLKRLFGGAEAAAPAVPAAAAARPRRELMDVVDAFLTQNPQSTPYSVHALIAAGGAELEDSQTVLQVCERIAAHGYQYPLNPTLREELKKHEILPYLQWQAASGVAREEYCNENTIRKLIRRFRDEAG